MASILPRGRHSAGTCGGRGLAWIQCAGYSGGMGTQNISKCTKNISRWSMLKILLIKCKFDTIPASSSISLHVFFYYIFRTRNTG